MFENTKGKSEDLNRKETDNTTTKRHTITHRVVSSECDVIKEVSYNTRGEM